MSRYVRLEDNIVVEVFVNETSLPMDRLFHPSIIWLPCDDTAITINWRYDKVGKLFHPPGDDSIPPTAEEILKIMQDAIQSHMDTKACERNYDGILSLCTYATSTNPKFAAEGQAGVEWRDACWAKGYEIMDDVLAGNREIPTVEELLAELPVFYWPGEVITDEVTP